MLNIFFSLSPTGDGVPEQSRIRHDRQGKPPPSPSLWSAPVFLGSSRLTARQVLFANQEHITALMALLKRPPLPLRLPLLTLAAVVVTYGTLPLGGGG